MPLALHVMTRLVLGGPSRPVLALLAALPSSGWTAGLAVGNSARGEHELLDLVDPDVVAPGIAIDRVAGLVREPRPLSDLRALVRIVRMIRGSRPVLVHTHTAKAGAIGRLAARLAGTGARTVHTFHGHSLDRAVSGRGAPIWTAIERGLGRLATDRIVALSPGQRDDLVSRLGPRVAPIRVVPLAFDARGGGHGDGRAERDAIRRDAGDGQRVVAFCGRGVPVKRLDLLARAVCRLAATDPARAGRLRVAILGPVDAAVRRAIESELVPRSLIDRFVFVGPVADPLPHLAHADALVLPSLSEGTPVAILEALHLGLPVVASAAGGVPEMLASDWSPIAPGAWRTTPAPPRGLLVPVGGAAGDPEAWASVLRMLVDDPALVPGDPDERRRFVREVFDPARRAEETAAIYEEIVGRPVPGRLEAAGRH